MVEDDSPENVTDEGDVPIEGVRIIGPDEAIEVTAREAGVRDEGGDPDPTEAMSPTSAKPANPTDYGAVPVVKIDDMGQQESPAETPAEGASSPASPPSEDGYELPHYSDPPTGQVPKVVIGDDPDATWTELADQPRWRETDREFETQDFSDLIGSEPTLGAQVDDSEDDSDEIVLSNRRIRGDSPPAVTPEQPDVAGSEFFDAGADLTEEDASIASGAGGSARGPRRDLGARPGLPADVSESGHGEDGDVVAPVPSRPAPGPRTRRKREASGAKGGDRNLPVAVGVGLALIAVGIACFMLGSLTTTILVAVILLRASFEFFTAAEGAGYRPARFPGMVAVVALAVAPLFSGFFAYPVVLGLAVMVCVVWFQQIQPGPNLVMNLGVTFLGIMYVGFLGSFATLGLGVARPFEGSDVPNQGIGLLFAAVMVAVCHDVGAYFAGKYLGNRKLSAASPNKTLEGLAGGVLAAIVIPTIVLGVFTINPVGESMSTAFAFSLVCALVAPVGDLCESAIKRDLGVKDMGSLLPSHGGVLDRFDALLFVLPTAYFMAHLLGIGSPVSF